MGYFFTKGSIVKAPKTGNLYKVVCHGFLYPNRPDKKEMMIIESFDGKERFSLSEKYITIWRKSNKLEGK